MVADLEEEVEEGTEAHRSLFHHTHTHTYLFAWIDPIHSPIVDSFFLCLTGGWVAEYLIFFSPNSIRAGLQPKTEQLLREKTSLMSSLHMADEAISAAQYARSGLESQRQVFGSFTGNLAALGNQFPVIRRTIGQIRSKKHRDTIVLSSVLALLIIFTIWYTSKT